MVSKDNQNPRANTEIVAVVNQAVASALPRLSGHRRSWLTTHLTKPRAITASRDPDGAVRVEVWLVTDHVGENDASSRVVYDPAERAFGLLTELQDGVLWYGGPYASLVAAVENI
jgi:hypothetical protein